MSNLPEIDVDDSRLVINQKMFTPKEVVWFFIMLVPLFGFYFKITNTVDALQLKVNSFCAVEAHLQEHERLAGHQIGIERLEVNKVRLDRLEQDINSLKDRIGAYTLIQPPKSK